jgi:hypothetical protein
MKRRRLFALLAFVLPLTIATPAFAGSYLDRAALLLDEARREGDMLQPRTQDKEMVLIVKALAEARAKVGRKMEVPAAVVKAHPHLLLVLENCERATDAAAEGNFKKFMEHLTTARDEERTFRALIAELGYTLPEAGARR